VSRFPRRKRRVAFSRRRGERHARVWLRESPSLGVSRWCWVAPLAMRPDARLLSENRGKLGANARRQDLRQHRSMESRYSGHHPAMESDSSIPRSPGFEHHICRAGCPWSLIWACSDGRPSVPVRCPSRHSFSCVSQPFLGDPKSLLARVVLELVPV
jgi:hypothetical protein